MTKAPERPRLLIEDWLPIDQIGAESQRERGASSALPPISFLHVWWARRPLSASRAAILASLLPAWSNDWPDTLQQKFPDKGAYIAWFLGLLGIQGDPAQSRRIIQWAKGKKLKLTPEIIGGLPSSMTEGLPPNMTVSIPFGYKRGFTHNLTADQEKTLKALLEHTWEDAAPTVLDAFSGGGAIPFESLRLGLPTVANELNPVASVILKATLDFPARHGVGLAPTIEKWGKRWAKEVQDRLDEFFPRQDGESIHAYIWTRTVACPYTGKPIPLSPNWWLSKGARPVAVRPIFDPSAEEAQFAIVDGKDACRAANPDTGTVSRGNGVSPWAQSQVVDGDYIKAEAQAGRMGQQLYAVAIKKQRGGLEFRAPTERDLAAVAAAAQVLESRLPDWRANGMVPTEDVPQGNKTSEAHRYGAGMWMTMFSPRQLLSQCTALEVLLELGRQIEIELDPEPSVAVRTYLAMSVSKALNYNSRMCAWHPTRVSVANTFDRHDFSFKWSHGEFDAAHKLYFWAVDQVVDAYKGIAKLATPEHSALLTGTTDQPVERLQILNGNAADLSALETGSVTALVTDPPYYDNVMYAECADFFYVWMKRSLGDVYPEFFSDPLTNKDDEAVANVARFASMGRQKKQHATDDYENKMGGCFREMHRVLRDDGVLTVMFTHKKVEAWDTLGAALIHAGFTVDASWPVHTEAEHSLHQAKKNAAASTIFLTCRKRALVEGEEVWWDDLKNEVRKVARDKAAEYEALGIRGVDLYLSTFGPVLAVISERWPVYTSEVNEQTGEPKTLRPEAALEIAREEVVGLRRRGLLLGRAIEFAPVTAWYLMAWDAFRAEQFPADDARKLALALGVELEATLISKKKVLTKKSGNVVLNLPSQRRGKNRVDEEAESLDCLLDVAHTAMLVFGEDGGGACRRWLASHHLEGDSRIQAVFQAMVNAIPATKDDEGYIRPEMATLDTMNDALGLGLEFPIPEEEIPQPVQGTLPLGVEG